MNPHHRLILNAVSVSVFMLSSAFQHRPLVHFISILVDLENVLIFEQILRNLFSAKKFELSEQLPTSPLFPFPVVNSVTEKQLEQPLDLSMKMDLSPAEDFGYGSGSERPSELHEVGLENLIVKQQLSPDGQRFSEGKYLQCRFHHQTVFFLNLINELV